MRADFEIYKLKCYDGKIRYAFNVEYWGHYVCDTLKEAKQKVKRVKLDVQIRLEQIEIENQKYYEKLNRQIEKAKKELQNAKKKHY